MKRLKLINIGPIREANIEFGDLTIFVGGQAMGKSITLEMVKLIEDAGYIRNRLEDFGFDCTRVPKKLLPLFLGAGKESIWGEKGRVFKDGDEVSKNNVLNKNRSKNMGIFFIPAQRVVVVENGWPKPFSTFDTMYPFCAREFSEIIRTLLDKSYAEDAVIFPQANRLRKELRDEIGKTIFKNGSVKIITNEQNRKILSLSIHNDEYIPIPTWSTGQREFIPLLCGLYYCLPSQKKTKVKTISTVIIEEIEMGLHPQAIITLMLLVYELIYRGYKVILSTHSQIVLDVVWAVYEINKVQTLSKNFYKLFGIEKNTQYFRDLAKTIEDRKTRVFYFHEEEENTTVKDISGLDPGSDDDAISGWGGLSGFSGKIAEVVGEALDVK